MARIFISYKRVDKDKVFRIKDQIESALGEKCWIDLDGIESDAQFKNVIIRAIIECKVVLFMYSKAHSKIIDFENDWTFRELNFASKKNKKIVFVNIDGSKLTDAFEFDYGTKQQVDGRNSHDLKKLIADLQNWLQIYPKLQDVCKLNHLGRFNYTNGLKKTAFWKRIMHVGNDSNINPLWPYSKFLYKVTNLDYVLFYLICLSVFIPIYISLIFIQWSELSHDFLTHLAIFIAMIFPSSFISGILLVPTWIFLYIKKRKIRIIALIFNLILIFYIECILFCTTLS